MAHALVIGGTGMLAGATHALAEDGDVSVLSRHAAAFCRGHAQLHAEPCDWSSASQLLPHVEAAIAARGAVSIALVWMHQRADTLPLEVGRVLARRGPVRFFHVMGSAVSDPSRPDRLLAYERAFGAVPNLAWRPVMLGFQIENGGSRWLTNEEISGGAIAAIRSDARKSLIGQVEPWEARP
jgi:hypothetical protein